MYILLVLLLVLPVSAHGWDTSGKLTGSYRFIVNKISSGAGTVDITAQHNRFFLYDMRENNYYFSKNMIGFKGPRGHLHFYEKYGAYGQMKGSTTYDCAPINSYQYACRGIKNFECFVDEQCFDLDTCYLEKIK